MKIITETLKPNGAGLTGYLLDSSKELANITSRPTVLILPGGGYRWCSDREAEPVAMAYLHYGYHAFVLRYSAKPRPDFTACLQDAEEAMAYLRNHAEELGVDAGKIAAVGFSAGGHLAACQATMGREKPNALILGYPLILEEWGRECLVQIPSASDYVTEDTPPAFLFAAQDDDTVPIKNGYAFAQALSEKGVPCETHIFLHGGHGFSLAMPHTSSGSEEAVNQDVAQWFSLNMAFLNHIFGEFPIYKETGAADPDASALDLPIGTLLDMEGGKEILEQYLPGIVVGMETGAVKIEKLKLRRIAEVPESNLSEEVLAEIEKAFQIRQF